MTASRPRLLLTTSAALLVTLVIAGCGGSGVHAPGPIVAVSEFLHALAELRPGAPVSNGELPTGARRCVSHGSADLQAACLIGFINSRSGEITAPVSTWEQRACDQLSQAATYQATQIPTGLPEVQSLELDAYVGAYTTPPSCAAALTVLNDVAGINRVEEQLLGLSHVASVRREASVKLSLVAGQSTNGSAIVQIGTGDHAAQVQVIRYGGQWLITPAAGFSTTTRPTTTPPTTTPPTTTPPTITAPTVTQAIATPTTPVRAYLAGLTDARLNAPSSGSPSPLPARAQACGELALEARQLACLKSYIRHHPAGAHSAVTAGERQSCAQLTPMAAGQVAAIPLGIDPVGVAIADAASGARTYPPSCPYALSAMDSLGDTDRAVAAITDIDVALETSRPDKLWMKVIARQGHYATVRVGDSQSAIEVVHTGRRWLIARLNVN